MSGNKKIIIVDDDSDVGCMTEEILRHVGKYSTLLCESAASALSKIQYEFIPDLVITDLQMPVMDGLELTQKIKDAMPDLPIIILTGRTDLVPENSLADMVIEKPYRLEEFLEEIQRFLA